METWGPVIWALTPTVIVGLAFWGVMRAILHSDRNERAAYARLEAEERRRRAERAAQANGSDTPDR
ncbi:MAG TPA: hypothetical protein GX406_02440 [Pseudoclavibacter sp.]|nr:hypothetical protein [Pseudoclavibacter sp.]